MRLGLWHGGATHKDLQMLIKAQAKHSAVARRPIAARMAHAREKADSCGSGGGRAAQRLRPLAPQWKGWAMKPALHTSSFRPQRHAQTEFGAGEEKRGCVGWK